MGLLAPWFLAGAAAIGLPLYLHLLRQHRQQLKPFSSLMFFERRTHTSVKQRRLRYLALLALRLALILLLVLAFAQPFVTRAVGPQADGERLVVLGIDDSFSMRRDGLFDQAKQAAIGELGQLKPGDQAIVVAVGAQSRLLTQQSRDKNELQAAITNMTPGDTRSAFGEFARVLRGLATTTKARMEAHLYSDLQKTSMPTNFGDLQLPPNATLITHGLMNSRVPNWTVESVLAPQRVYSAKKVRVQATVGGIGTEGSTKSVSALLNGRVQDTKTVTIPPSGRATVEFAALDVPFGLNRGEIKVSPNDALARDDSFRFVIERGDPRRILFVHETRQPRGLLYYQTAMESTTEGGFQLDPVTVDQAANIDPKRDSMVVLSDVASLPSSFESALRKYVEDGGALMIALGPVSAVKPRIPVVDEGLDGSRNYARDYQTIGSFDPEHPAFRRAGRWEGVRFYQAVKVNPSKLRVIASLSDGTPALLEGKLGAGRVLVFTSTFDNLSNDFPLHPSFVPFVEQCAQYLTGAAGRPANLPVGGYVELRAPGEQGSGVEVLGPEGQRALTLNEAKNAETFALPQEGYYEVRRSNGRNSLFAANADRRESDLDPLPQETLTLWRNTGATAANTTAAGAAVPPPVDKWWWGVLLVALLVAVAESLLASRYLSVQGESR